MFLADGYLTTTLEAVAGRAGVGARTVYVRFGTKAALFKRVVDVAIVGDTQPVDVMGRDWAQAMMTAPTAAERIAASAAVGRQIMQRTGALFAVAQQAAALEPAVAGFWQQGREQSRRANAAFWTKMRADGLLDPAVDLAWLIDTSSILSAARWRHPVARAAYQVSGDDIAAVRGPAYTAPPLSSTRQLIRLPGCCRRFTPSAGQYPTAAGPAAAPGTRVVSRTA